MNKLEFSGQDAVIKIAEMMVLQDSYIERVLVERSPDSIVTVTLCSVPRRDSPVAAAELVLSGVKELEIGWDDGNAFLLVARYKLLSLRDGCFYLSLEPFDEHSEEPSDDDEVLFVAAELKALLELRD